MNRNQKIIISMLVLAMMAFSAMATAMSHATVPSNTLTIRGSSTILPVAVEEASNWQNYWNTLYANNQAAWSGYGIQQCTAPVDVTGTGSGNAIPALIANTANIGEMSRPPTNDGTEWGNAAMANMQIWAIGVDSVAIVVSPDMTWMPKDLTVADVHSIFAASPLLNTWGDFLTAYYNGQTYNGVARPSSVPSSINGVQITSDITSAPINRAVRDPSSGTFDCFQTYFGTPANGVTFKSGANMATYTYCQENINVYNTVSAGTLAAHSEYIGFIALGYLETYGNMIPLNISYNTHNLSTAPTSLISYDSTQTWGPYVTPTRANVIWGFSNVKGATATGQYFAWRWLWEVTPSTINAQSAQLEAGVWIAYMRATGTTTGGVNSVATTVGTGASSFVNDAGYIELSRADISGGKPLDSNLATYTPLAGQTKSIPDGKVNFNDVTYFVSAYMAFTTTHTYNPYADINADGKMNFNDVTKFVSAYQAYFVSYNK